MSKLLFEIGFEEFPPSFVAPVCDHLKKNIEKEMKSSRIVPEVMRSFFTSSRVAVIAEGFPATQPPLRELVTGAPKRIALNEDGTLSRAGESFLKKNSLQDYFFENTKKGEVIAGYVEDDGRASQLIIKDILDKAISSIPFRKSMRWADNDLMFARPINWFLLVIDDAIVEHNYRGIEFSKTSFGHRFLSPKELPVNSDNYENVLEENYVIADYSKRKERIKQLVFDIAKEKGGKAYIDNELLEEVTNTVEWPYAITGDIPSQFLLLPSELITLAMKKHQKFFSIVNADGEGILPHFVSILNNIPRKDSIVKKGNEKVLLARLSDAAFFFEKDQKENFLSLTEKLKTMLFQKDLGSYFDKVSRIKKIAVYISTNFLSVSGDSLKDVEKTVSLMKNDLLSGMVFEFTDLQGVMGKYYAANAGENEVVATAIEEHYFPRFAEDNLPSSIVGKIVSMADKIDTVAGAFMAGLKPTGTKDKYAIRRNTISLLLVTSSFEQKIDLKEIFKFAASLIKTQNSKLDFDMEDLLNFVKQRYNAIFDADTPVIQSAVEAGFTIPSIVRQRVNIILELQKDDDVNEMAQLFKRSKNILKKADSVLPDVDSLLFSFDEEKSLFELVVKIEKEVLSLSDAFDAAKKIILIKPALDTFFDKVMVMDKDENVKLNRLSLLSRIVTLVKEYIGDISFLNI